ncbi:MAG: zinc metallopeptidase [Ruminococcaceae bacterium]|nr:zinc metallopeptidase [Oscillospiraceae bacterium]
MWWIDSGYIMFVLPALILTFWAQFNVSSTYAKYGKIYSRRGMTAEQVARMILDKNGLYHVQLGRVRGNLTDHFNPKTNIVNLSDTTCTSTSVAAIGVAAHEVGHAIQHATGYVPIKIRNSIVPVVNIASQAAIPLFIIGLFFNSGLMMDIGIWFFSAAVLFQIITLPVEFNASRRAIAILEGNYILEDEEVRGAKKVLSAAAMTYVAAAAMALAQLLRLLSMRGRRD